MGRSVLIYVMGTFIILSVALLNANKTVDTAGSLSVHYMSDARARNICNSMTSILLSRIADSTALRIETPETTTFMGGTVTYQVNSVNSIGDVLNDDHQGDDHGDDHESDDHEDDHSANFNSKTFSNGNILFSASLLGAFPSFNAFFSPDDDHEEDDHSDDHESDDHEGDDHEGDDHDGDGDGNSDVSDTLQIVVSATFSNSTKTLTTYVAINPPTSTSIPTAIQAGVSTRNPVSTSGTMNVDGRNHDLNGTLVSGTGTYGIWTTSTINQSGSSDIGGTYSGTDYAPSKPANSNAIKASATYSSGSYPDTPDKVLGGSAGGFPEGTLKNIAISGANGGQYVTNPSSLTTPFSGVTYVELSSGSDWQPSSISGSGVLIVHNAAGNAIIKNLNSGTFKGIIIADDIIHVHATIIGAIVGLSASPSEGNCIGNGNGSVLYSTEAINQSVGLVSGSTEGNYGFGKTRLNIIGWYE